ncbi:MAG: DUF1877 family protein [Leptolyngbyaceae cyanobacterium bins.302]|nr:DUF1877 family protein [Leptolyngbyaceae cyanobacterium bins.302]
MVGKEVFKIMSVTAWLQHISAKGLQRTKKDPEVFEQVIMDLSPAGSDAPLISSLSELTSAQIDVLKEITSEIDLVLNRWSIYDVEVLEDLKSIFPEIYARLKPELYLIVSDEKDCSYLDLNRAWSHVSSLFLYGTSMEPSTFVSRVNNCHRINIFAGKQIDPVDKFFPMRYQEVDEVLEMAQSLKKIDEWEIRQRFERALQEQTLVYRYRWEEESYSVLLEYCKAVQAFYQTAAAQGFGIVNAIS